MKLTRQQVFQITSDAMLLKQIVNEVNVAHEEGTANRSRVTRKAMGEIVLIANRILEAICAETP